MISGIVNINVHGNC